MGWGGKKGGRFDPPPQEPAVQLPGENDDELIWTAVTDCVQPILRLEHELDQNKLEKRIRDCFKKGVKGVGFHGKPWYQCINEYADTVFAALFNSLGDKEWMGQCDFLLCLDSGVKDNFPKQLLARVPQLEFERVVLAAHDRAHEEQRVLPIMWEVITSTIEGPKGKKKVYNALEESFKECRPPPSAGNPEEIQQFVGGWIDQTVARLSAVAQGEPQWVMEPETAMLVFDSLLQAGAVPMALVEAHGPPPPGWQFIGYAVQQAYAAHVVTEDGSVFGKEGKGKGGNRKKVTGKASKPRPVNPLLADVPPGMCRDFLLDRCSRGDECKFNHDDVVKAEVALKRALQEAENEGESDAKRARHEDEEEGLE